MYYTYMLRCLDNSIYTGITTDLERRITEHIERSNKCAKYTQSHQGKKLEIAWESENRVLASKLEYYLKTLPKAKKEILIKNPEILQEFLGKKINCEKYNKHILNINNI